MPATRVLSLDVSTKTGFAVLDTEDKDGEVCVELVRHGLLKLPKPADFKNRPYPWNYLDASNSAADLLVELVVGVDPGVIVVEETNLAKARYSQKLLEFLHHALMNKIGEKTTAGTLAVPVFYLSTSEWRRALGLVMSKADKGNNKLLKAAKERHALHKAQFVPQTVVSPRGKVTQTKPRSLHSFKAELSITGKVDWKDLSVRFVNERYGMEFEKSDNDPADAICLATAFALGARPCDGVK